MSSASTEEKGGVVTPQLTEERGRVCMTLREVGEGRGGEGVEIRWGR